MSFSAGRWRAPVMGAVTGMVVAAAVVGSSALASGGGTPAPRITRASINCASPAGAVVKAPAGDQRPSDGPGDAPFLAAVAQMVQTGTIDEAQAHALDADIRTGRIDTDQLVANGTLSQAQANTVMNRLGAVKRSLAPAAGQSPSPTAAEKKRLAQN